MWITEGKERATLNPYEAPTHDAYFVNQRPDNLHLNNRQLNHSIFIDVGFKGARIRNVDFSHSTFVRCYFRGAELRGVNLTGCRFTECDFRDAILINCNLSYSQWAATEIGEAQILSNLPAWPNVAHELLESLRRNALGQSNGPAARKYLFKAMSYSREHYWRMAFSEASYYRTKYRGLRRVVGAIQWLRSSVERWFWGYGERPVLLFGWAGFAIIAFATIYAVSAPELFRFGASPMSSAVGSALKFSALTFATNSPTNIPRSSLDRIESAMVIESLFGIVFTGVLAAVVYRRISIRQGK